MALDYLFIIGKPYQFKDVAQQIATFCAANGKSVHCIESTADAAQIARRLAVVHGDDRLNQDTTVVVLGQHSPGQGQAAVPGAHGVQGGGAFPAETLLHALHGLVVGKTATGADLHWSGITYFNDSSPDVIQALQGVLGSEDAVILRERDVRDTRSLDAELAWLKSLDSIEGIFGKQATRLLSASKYFPENITILQQGLSPLLLKTPATFAESTGLNLSTSAQVKAFVQAEDARLEDPALDADAKRSAVTKLQVLKGGLGQLERIGMTEAERRLRALGALKLSIARGGLEAFRAFIASMPRTAVSTYVNAGDNDVKTALAYAAATGNPDLVLEVLNAGALLSTTTDFVHPLVLAASQGHAPVVNLLIEHARDAAVLETIVNVTWEGNTALMAAAMGGHLDVATALVDAGASPAIKNQWGETALMVAAMRKPEIVEMFLNRDPTAWGTIDAATKDGDTALLVAATAGQTRSVASLLAHGANHRVRSSNGATALMAAAYGRGDASTLQLLLQDSYKDVLNWHDNNGATALWHAADVGAGERARILFLSGADASIRQYVAQGNALLAARDKAHDDFEREARVLQSNFPFKFADGSPIDETEFIFDDYRALRAKATQAGAALDHFDTTVLGPEQLRAEAAKADILARQKDHSYEWRSQADVLLGQLEASGGAFKSAWLINSHDESFDYDSAMYARTGAYSLHNSESGNSERVDGSSALHLKAPADWAALVGLPRRPLANASETEWSAYTEALKTRYRVADRTQLLAQLREQAGLTLDSHFSGSAAASQADTWQLGAAADSALVIVQDDSGHTDRQLVVDASAAAGGATYWVQRDNVAIQAGEGDDEILLVGDRSAIAVDGGDGEDTVSFADALAGRSLGVAELAQLHDIETIMGSAHADSIGVDAAAAGDPDLDIPRRYHWGGGGADRVSLLDGSSHEVTIGAGQVNLGAGNDLIEVARAHEEEGALQVDGGGGANTLSLAALAGVRIERSGDGYAWNTLAAAHIGVFQGGQVLTAARTDEHGRLQFEGSWLQQASALSEAGVPELRISGSAIDAVYFGEALLDPQDAALHADAHTLSLWKSALQERLQTLQGELDRLTEQRAHSAPYELRTLDGEAAPAWAHIAGGALQITAPQGSGNLPLEILATHEGAQASHILSVDSQRFDGRIQLGSDGNDILVYAAGQRSLLAGGRGNDTYQIEGSLGNAAATVFENADEGLDTVYSEHSASLADHVERLILGADSSAPRTALGNAQDNDISTTRHHGHDALYGLAGNDRLTSDAGDDLLDGGEGEDIGYEQLWLRKVAAASPLDRYDLEVQLMGTGDKVTIAGWERAGGFAPYDPNANRIKQIKSSDGKTLSDTKVAQLVQAMASMAPPSGATSWSQLSASQQAQLHALGAWSY